jgi:UPF0755 protein
MAIIGALVIALAVSIFSSVQGNFKNDKKVIFIQEDTSPEILVEQLKRDSILTSTLPFDLLIKLKSVRHFKAGRYLIEKGISTSALINKFRAGLQEPLLVKVDGVREVFSLCGTLGKQLKYDSLAFINALLNPDHLSKYNLDTAQAVSLIIPNNYEMYWNITPENFLSKMIEVHDIFWTEQRTAKAQKLNLSKAEVYTLASIVKGETVKLKEAKKIAGLYLNRLQRGIPLEADPTITFALNLKKAQRVYFKDLKVESPYNTYKNRGLPPGPIYLVETSFLEAVLDADKHSYIFMCAQPGGTGFHDFSETYSQHLTYASRYRAWLNEKNIR